MSEGQERLTRLLPFHLMGGDSLTWNHNLCDSCYQDKRRENRLPRKEPIRVLPGGIHLFDFCCLCGTWNDSRIYVRADPGLMPCNHWNEVLT